LTVAGKSNARAENKRGEFCREQLLDVIAEVILQLGHARIDLRDDSAARPAATFASSTARRDRLSNA
jgi:hypothetical protein